MPQHLVVVLCAQNPRKLLINCDFLGARGKTTARPTGFDAGLVELVLPAAAIAQAAQAYGQADNITVVTIQPATLEKCAIS